MLNAFKIKPFDLEPIYAEWKDAPRFVGNPKKDLPVDDWLAQIKAGCVERKVPREYWHKVAQHYMADKAKTRFDELKLVMKNMHGGKYRWTWKHFKIAMRNMGWDIDPRKTEAIKVESKPSGLWWIVGRGDKDAKESAPAPASVEPIAPRPPPKSRHTLDVTATMKSLPSIPMPKRSATMSSVDTVSSISSPSSSSLSSSISSFFTSAKNTPLSTPGSSVIASPASTPGDTVTTVSQVPTWLVNACQSLEFLTNEHPKVMTALSAVLITVGSLPALPAISAGAGGAFLASSTAHAIGSLAVGLGTILQAQTDGKLQVTQGENGKSQVQSRK